MTVIEKFSHQEITCWKLGTSWWGKPKMYVHSFLIGGVLIDTGHAYIGNAFIKALHNENIDKIILSHHHEDHSSNVESIKEHFHVQAYGSPLCCQLMRNPPLLEPARRFTWGQNHPANVIPLDTSKKIETSSFAFDIIETPGHAIDQISLYEPSRGWLFSGDIFIHDYIKSFMRDEHIYQQINSIKSLLHLDFDALICNHQPVFRNGKKRLVNKLQFLEDFAGSVSKEYAKNGSVSQTMKSLQIRENYLLKAFSLGQLSARNMVLSAINDAEK